MHGKKLHLMMPQAVPFDVADKIKHYLYYLTCRRCSSLSGVVCEKGFGGRRKVPQKTFWMVDIKKHKILRPIILKDFLGRIRGRISD